jgi:2-oxoglutarate ferredoxin oxidoreductase subunit alpha
MMEKRFRKLQAAYQEIRSWPDANWRYGDPHPEIGIIGWGSTAGPAREAVDRAMAEGIRVQCFFPRILSPLPEDELRSFMGQVKAVIVPELNLRGHLADVLQARFMVEVHRLKKYEGLSFTAGDIYRKIVEVHKEWAIPSRGSVLEK